MNDDDFLSDAGLVRLTGRRQKSQQIAQLRKMGVTFFINASGHPVVSRSVIDGAKREKAAPTWTPTWAASRA